ncbi:MAG: hypothetical protein CM15mP23_13500 [Cryomorphaceae bacterium]|nr:MAG: hypothetical protein CM15mP23_13500 [Cryomorphaceae bacterium]
MIAHLFLKLRSYFNYRLKAVNAHGLHSPFLFDFYNEVIAAKKEFYFFKQFRRLLSAYTKFISEADALFLFRWVAFYKPNSVFVASENFPASLALAIPSNQKSLSVSSLHQFSTQELNIFEGVGVSLSEGHLAELIYLEEIDAFTKDIILNYKCVIIRKPHQNELKDNIWMELCSLKDISISIDLFQFGILLFDKKISKQHFVVKMR